MLYVIGLFLLAAIVLIALPRLRSLLPVLLAVAVFPAMAFAQAVATTVPNESVVVVDSLFGTARPYIMELISILIGAVVLYAAKLLRDFTGITIESKHREALQSALRSGADLVVNKYLPTSGSIDVKSASLKVGLDYVVKSVPDAIDHFGLTPERLRELLEPKVAAAEALATTVVAMPEITVDGATLKEPTNGGPAVTIGG